MLPPAMEEYIPQYSFIVGIHMIAALFISILFFLKYPSQRKYIVLLVGYLAFFEYFIFFFPPWMEGALIWFLTLTCLGVMAAFQFARKSRYRIPAGVFFVVLGCLLLTLSFESFFNVYSYLYVRSLVRLILMLFSISAALTGGLLILVTAFKERVLISA